LSVRRTRIASGTAALLATAAALSMLAYAVGALFLGPDPGWPPMTRASARAASVNALLLSGLWTIVMAPLAAVMVTRRCRQAGTVAEWVAPLTRLAAAIACYVAMSAVIAIALTNVQTTALAPIAFSHITLGTGMLAFAAVGVFFSAMLRDPLDAGLASLAVTLTLGIGILVGGPSVSDLPRGIVNAALAGSPLVASAAAANIDLLRLDILYHVSPIAHFQFAYPSWYAAAGLYVASGLLLLGGSMLVVRTTGTRDERMVR
jgi:hypothetical protein